MQERASAPPCPPLPLLFLVASRPPLLCSLLLSDDRTPTSIRTKKLMRETSPQTSEAGTRGRYATALKGRGVADRQKSTPPSFLLRGSNSARTASGHWPAGVLVGRWSSPVRRRPRQWHNRGKRRWPADLLVCGQELRMGGVLVCGEEVWATRLSSVASSPPVGRRPRLTAEQSNRAASLSAARWRQALQGGQPSCPLQ